MASVLFFYDAPTPPGIFDELLAIPAIGGNVSTTSFSDFVQSTGPVNYYNGQRLVVDAVMWWNMDLTMHIASFSMMHHWLDIRQQFSTRL